MIGNPGMTLERRTELATRWRQRAGQLDTYARRCRAEGDVREADDADQAATEYRIAADDLEAAR